MQDKLRTLSEWLHVNPEELRFGLQSAVQAQEPEASYLGLQDREMLAQYLRLPPADRRTVQEVVAALAAARAGRMTP